MSKIKDEAIEERIMMEIVVDAYDSEERMSGWFHYLQDEIAFPFKGKCIFERTISPLKKDEKVKVLDIAPYEDCRNEIVVIIEWLNRTFGVPLSQLQYMGDCEDTRTSIEDWHYWIDQGYKF